MERGWRERRYLRSPETVAMRAEGAEPRTKAKVEVEAAAAVGFLRVGLGWVGGENVSTDSAPTWAVRSVLTDMIEDGISHWHLCILDPG
jgi:hypothetical protein